jgi:hypothetical protein
MAVVVMAGGCGGSVADPWSVAFAGSECSIDLPDSVPPGDYTFVLTNTSDRTSLPVYVAALGAGHTYDDFAALQSAAGAYFPLPEWAEYALRNFDVSESDPASGQRRFAYTLEPGEHAVYLWASRPAALWLCGRLSVSED